MKIKEYKETIDGVNEITEDTETGETTITLVHPLRPRVNLYDGEECIASYESDKEFIEDYKKMKQENQSLKDRINTYENPEDLTLMFMYCDEKAKDKIKELKDRIEKKDFIINELEKWLKDIKEGIEELTIGFQEWGHPAKPSIVIDDVLNKLQELKGDK